MPRATTAAWLVMPPREVRMPFGDFHAVNIVRLRFRADQNHGGRFRFGHRFIGGEYDHAYRRAGRGGQSGRDQIQALARRRIEHRVQQLIELLRIDALHRFALGDQPFAHHLDGDPHRRRARALAVAGLQHVQLVIFDGEFEILDVAIVLLQVAGDLAQLIENVGHDRLQFLDRLRRADAGHHVLALRVDQELAVEFVLAGRRIAREADAGGRRLAQVAEHHRLHVHGGAEAVGDAIHLAIVDRAGVVPGAEHRVPGHHELLARVLRKRLAALLLDQLLVIHDDGFQIVGGQVGVELRLHLLLAAVEDGVEIVLLHVEHDGAEHLDEAPVAVLREARIAALLFRARRRSGR